MREFSSSAGHFRRHLAGKAGRPRAAAVPPAGLSFGAQRSKRFYGRIGYCLVPNRVCSVRTCAYTASSNTNQSDGCVNVVRHALPKQVPKRAREAGRRVRRAAGEDGCAQRGGERAEHGEEGRSAAHQRGTRLSLSTCRFLAVGALLAVETAMLAAKISMVETRLFLGFGEGCGPRSQTQNSMLICYHLAS